MPYFAKIGVDSEKSGATPRRRKTFTQGRYLGKGTRTKTKTLHATEAESERVQKLRTEYWTTIGEVKLSDLVFIDETGVNLAMTLGYARAIKGKRAYSKCPFNRGRNVTLIGAIAMSGLIASFTFQGWTNQDIFLTYVTSVLAPQLWSGACVVMDNLPAHKATKVREAIESVGARAVFLSPYSEGLSPEFSSGACKPRPDFNPIENTGVPIETIFESGGISHLLRIRARYSRSTRFSDLQ